MSKTMFGILIILLAPLPALAQQSSNYVYGIVGPVVVPKSAYTRWNGDFIHVAGGGEGRITDRFALGGEVGALLPVNNQYALTTGLASVTPAFHFFPKESTRKFDPFAVGGLDVLFANGGGSVGFHYGGGVNYWVKRRLAVRCEFRDHVWSPESGETVHLVDFRFGIVVGLGGS